MANPPITDPLADWPRVDPQEDDLRAWAKDLTQRAQELQSASQAMAKASNGTSEAYWELTWQGSAATATRARWAKLAVATVGAETAVTQVASALTGYASAFDTYQASMVTAHATAARAMSDEEDAWAAYAAKQGPMTVSKADLELDQIGPYYVPPASPNRALAKTQANDALDTFKQAGLAAAEQVFAAAWTMEPGSVNSANGCQAPVSSTDSLAGAGNMALHGALKGKSAYAGFNKGRNLYDLAKVGSSEEALRDLNQGKTAQEIAYMISFGRQGEDAAQNLSIAGKALSKLGASDDLLANLGKVAGYAGPPIAILGDTFTIVSANGETGLHGAVTRTAAGLNLAATATAGGLALSTVEIPGVDVVTGVIALGTAAYAVGDWIYDNKTAVWHFITGYQKPLVMP